MIYALKNKELLKAYLKLFLAFGKLIFLWLFAGSMFTALIDLIGSQFFCFAWDWDQQLEIYGVILLVVIFFTYWLSRLQNNFKK